MITAIEPSRVEAHSVPIAWNTSQCQRITKSSVNPSRRQHPLGLASTGKLPANMVPRIVCVATALAAYV